MNELYIYWLSTETEDQNRADRAAFKDMYDYSIIADEEISVRLSNDRIVYAEKRKAWGFKEE